MFDALQKYGLVVTNLSFKEKTSIKIGGKIKYYLEVDSIEKLQELLKYLSRIKMPYFIIGNGTNILASDEDFEIVVISLKKLNKIIFKDDLVIIEAGALNMKITNDIINEGYFFPYCLSLVPGTIGGAIYMNTSSNNQETKDYLIQVDYLDNFGNLHTLNDFSSFNYRSSFFQDKSFVIIRGVFKFLKQDYPISKQVIGEKLMIKKNTQPLDKYNMGSVFKNPCNQKAWELIKYCGLEEAHCGMAKVSEKHANFLINESMASFQEMMFLITFLQTEVFHKTKTHLELEIKIVRPSDINPYL